jgi:hypothetical protein
MGVKVMGEAEQTNRKEGEEGVYDAVANVGDGQGKVAFREMNELQAEVGFLGV